MTNEKVAANILAATQTRFRELSASDRREAFRAFGAIQGFNQSDDELAAIEANFFEFLGSSNARMSLVGHERIESRALRDIYKAMVHYELPDGRIQQHLPNERPLVL